ncbi:HAMP domain-containing sensor histidine kinase [soil metagenome]
MPPPAALASTEPVPRPARARSRAQAAPATEATAASIAELRRRAVDDARRGFLRAASHELRTPLNAIIGFSEIITHELHGPIGDVRYRDHAQVVRDSGLKLLKLVNQILEIARLEAGAADLDPRPELTAVAFADACKAVSDPAAAGNVTVVAAIEPGAEALLADGRGLHTILTTLLGQAVAISPPGGSVRLSARASGAVVRIEVEDDGPPVTPEDLRLLLRPFDHGERSSVRAADGAGLGLAVVNLLCKGMKGQMRLHCAPGRGLTACVRLPIA